MDTMASSSMENLGSITIMGSSEENTRSGSSQIIGKFMQLGHACMITNICKIETGWFYIKLYAHLTFINYFLDVSLSIYNKNNYILYCCDYLCHNHKPFHLVPY
jgi:hypothetical protein